ncbi:MAG: HK97-gp10 family putative phage morphogenesis protein [Candidatus Nanopelagicaceae bacterium]
MTVSFKMEGFEELIKQMDGLREEIGKGKTDAIWRKAMRFAMEPVLEDAKSFAPKDTGEMASRIYMKVHRPMARDKQGKRYAGEVYLARVTASPIRSDSVLKYTINKKGKLRGNWSNKSPAPVAQEFGNSRHAATPFMRPALELNIGRVESRLGWSIWQAIQKVAAKNKKE